MQVHGETKEDRLLRLLQLTRSAMDDYTEERDEQGLLPFDPNIGDVLVQHFFHPVQAERRRQRGEAPAEKVAPLEQFDATALKELEVRLAGVKGGIDGLEKEVGAIKSGARS